MVTRKLFLGLVVGLLVVVGCGSDDEKSPTPKPTPPETARFVPDTDPSDGSLYLRERSLDDDQLLLDIVAEGTPPLYGVAFRLETDAGVLGQPELLAQTPFAGGVAGLVEARPGLMVVTFSRVGDQPPVDEDVIGTLRLSRVQAAGATVRFVEGDSVLFDADAVAVDAASFIGGALVVP